MRAYSSRRALRTLSELSRSMARAESREELLELTGGCLRELGFRSYLADLEGDRFRLIADRLETESIAARRDHPGPAAVDPHPADQRDSVHPHRSHQALSGNHRRPGRVSDDPGAAPLGR